MRRRLLSCVLLSGAVALASCTAAGPVHPAPSMPVSSVPPTVAPAPPGPPSPQTAAIGPVFVEPNAGMAPIYAFMRGATTTLTMTMYELVDPRAEQILGADAARGVKVRVLLDSALENSRNQSAQVYLASHDVIVALAPAGRITHQKTICIDDRTCLIMSLNMVSDDYTSTRDVAVEDNDSRDVSAIEATFAADFSGKTRLGTSSADHLLWSPGSETGIVDVINGARRTLQVENEEMSSTAVTDALAAAAHRGVNVEVCMTADPDYSAALNQIADAGGHIHLYPDRTGVLYIHEKLILADAGTTSARAVVGSINFSTSSLDDNRELDIMLDTQDAAGPIATLESAFLSDFADAPDT